MTPFLLEWFMYLNINISMKHLLIGISLLSVTALTSCETINSTPQNDLGDPLKTLKSKADDPVDSLESNLIAYYPLNNSALDESGNHYNGTAFNLKPVCDRHNNPNSAYYFNGENSYITVEDNTDLRLNNTDFTINYWVSLDEFYPLSGSAVFSKNNGPNLNGWNCSITGLGFVDGSVGRAFYNVSGGSDPYVVGIKALNLSKWHMITVLYTLSASKIMVYVDGKQDQTSMNIPSPNPLTNAKLHIGKNSFNDPRGTTPEYFIKGKLDDMRIYNRKLSESQIAALYTCLK